MSEEIVGKDCKVLHEKCNADSRDINRLKSVKFCTQLSEILYSNVIYTRCQKYCVESIYIYIFNYRINPTYLIPSIILNLILVMSIYTISIIWAICSDS